MTEPTFICPTCKTEIKLTQSLVGPLLEATWRDFERRLALKESDISTREAALQALRARPRRFTIGTGRATDRAASGAAQRAALHIDTGKLR